MFAPSAKIRLGTFSFSFPLWLANTLTSLVLGELQEYKKHYQTRRLFFPNLIQILQKKNLGHFGKSTINFWT